jgi:transposase
LSRTCRRIFAQRARDLLDERKKLDQELIDAARIDPVTRMLMTALGVGTIVALTFRHAVDDPTRFAKVRSIGPWLGLTPRRYQSGETDRTGHVTKAGDLGTRTALYEAATTLLGRIAWWSALKRWGASDRRSTRNQEGPRCRRTKTRCYSAHHVEEQLPFRWSDRCAAA